MTVGSSNKHTLVSLVYYVRKSVANTSAHVVDGICIATRKALHTTTLTHKCKDALNRDYKHYNEDHNFPLHIYYLHFHKLGS